MTINLTHEFSRRQSASDSGSFEEVEGLHVVRPHHAFLTDEVAGSLLGPRVNNK